MKSSIAIKRAYEKPQSADGYRVLIDRLWPRGLSKGHARIDLWLKEIAPSTNLRTWFNHDPEKWDEFKKRYRAELKSNDQAISKLKSVLIKRKVTFIYSAKDTEHNNAVVLQHYLTQK